MAHGDALWPWRALGRASVPALLDSTFGAPGKTARRLAASWRTLALAEITHARPDWGIKSVVVDGVEHPVVEEVTAQTPFATLRRFRKVGVAEQPRVLVAAPMSGHFATLLRDEVGNSHTGRQLNIGWRAFLTEIEMEIQKYQVERAYQNTQLARGRSPAQPQQPLQIGIVQNWK